jgi:hypothetical protein
MDTPAVGTRTATWLLKSHHKSQVFQMGWKNVNAVIEGRLYLGK